MSKKAGQREAKPSKSKTTAPKTTQQEVTFEEEDEETTTRSVTRRLRPARSSKILAFERLKKVTSPVSGAESEESGEEEEAEDVSEYKPPGRKEKQAGAKRRSPPSVRLVLTSL